MCGNIHGFLLSFITITVSHNVNIERMCAFACKKWYVFNPQSDTRKTYVLFGLCFGAGQYPDCQHMCYRAKLSPSELEASCYMLTRSGLLFLPAREENEKQAINTSTLHAAYCYSQESLFSLSGTICARPGLPLNSSHALKRRLSHTSAAPAARRQVKPSTSMQYVLVLVMCHQGSCKSCEWRLWTPCTPPSRLRPGPQLLSTRPSLCALL